MLRIADERCAERPGILLSCVSEFVIADDSKNVDSINHY